MERVSPLRGIVCMGSEGPSSGLTVSFLEAELARERARIRELEAELASSKSTQVTSDTAVLKAKVADLEWRLGAAEAGRSPPPFS